ncbi:MAG: hypothetical protein P4M04_01300 [Acidobacteriota bacterium]|nr:hypothetical protein [Acidobacteriota bacterium]
MRHYDIGIVEGRLDGGGGGTVKSEASTMYWSIFVPGACLIVIAVLAIYVPTIYIRKTNKVIELLEQIAAKTRK